MSDFTNANMFQRRQILEEALAQVLRPVGDITFSQHGERSLAITVRRCEGHVEQELHSLWAIARDLETKLS